MAAVFLFALLATDISCILAKPVIHTREGSVRGTVLKTWKGREIFAFLGVPYAEPPIGRFRFRNPVPKRPWGGILDAQTEGEQCTQLSGNNVTGSEDCLFLNTYTPKRKRNALLPVMVFIHGGAFRTGNGNRTDYGPDYLLDKDIVLVTCNYRLGIFGFLSTGTMAASGNFGLKDQVLVLKWVKRNIRAFGGNPNDVTLFGQSAGSVSTHLHALSEQSKHLFNRYILQSGLAIYEWGFRSYSSYYAKAKKVGEMYNCPTNNTYSLVACLRKISASQLAQTESVFTLMETFLVSMWGPTMEPHSKTAFITDSPLNLLQQNKLKNSSFITGNCRDEALLGTQILYSNKTLYDIFALSPELIISQLLQYTGLFKERNATNLAAKIQNFYWGTEMPKDKDKVIRGYTNLVTDLIFFYPSVQYEQGLAQSSKQPFYTYLFNYRGTLSQTPLATKNNKDVGITHSDELIYLFPETASSLHLPINVKQSTSDRKIRNVMVDLWTTFAIKGVPQSSLLSKLSLWQPYVKKKTYLEIGNITEPVTTVQTSFFKKRMKFVRQLLDEI
ncbi:juvenile hormone esterase-like [Andrena cerasifolii]|uniref:juvenile hormone esterase-like n=1 Tax=Andrena cerasifolii TaxID=2819439 RepID=UPI00403806CD